MKSEELQKIRKIYENVAPEDLTVREQQLLHWLKFDKTVNPFNDLPLGRYRILQFATENFTDLSKTLQLLLPDFIKADQEQRLVIERFSGDNLTKSELIEVLQTLSQDTGEKISAYIGLFSDKEELMRIYQEEATAFAQQRSLSEYILAQALAATESFVVRQLREKLAACPEDQELVRALYQTGGNQARAAKLLYVHRNTLLNKIKKYEQRYGLQLLGSDLVLAYNLL